MSEKIDVKTALKAAEKAAQQIKVAAEALRQERAELEHQLSALRGQNELMYRQPLAPADVMAAILLAVDAWGEEFRRDWTPVLQDFTAPKGLRPRLAGPVSLDPVTFEEANAPMNLQDLEAVMAGGHTTVFAPALPIQHRSVGAMLAPHRNLFSGVLDATRALDNPSNQQLALKAAFFFFGDQIKAKVEKHFDLGGASMPSGSDDEQREVMRRNAARVMELSAALAHAESEIDRLQRMAQLERGIASINADRPTSWSEHQEGQINSHYGEQLAPLERELAALAPEGAPSATDLRLQIGKKQTEARQLREQIDALTLSAPLPVEVRRSLIAANEQRMGELQDSINSINDQLTQMGVS